MDFHVECYDELRAAVVKQAALDLLRLYQDRDRLQKTNDNGIYNFELREVDLKITKVLNFFNSPRFKLFTSFDKEYVLKQVNEKFKQYISQE